MQSKKHTLTGKEPHQDWQIQEFVEQQPPSPRLGKVMKVAILPVGDLSEQIQNFKPYRTFKTIGLDEFLKLCMFLEEIDFDCYNKESDPIHGYDAVFHVPEYELKFYDDDYMAEKTEELRNLFKKAKTD
ncbi:hypothetical protein [Vibrio bivalvicida]|uniref:Uncharacterized protein n=2 Tax=Vibrionaceae TaxID=641 RepID=A0A0H3ZSI3_9GAMM|nr:hypothetical protein [Enterovibrio norvegicus]